VFAGLCLSADGAFAAEPCELHRIAELQVTMQDLVPTVHAKINGRDAVFIADSGAFFSIITPSAAETHHLKLARSPYVVGGIGGDARARMTTVDTFTIFNQDLPKVPFLVAGNDLGHGLVGFLGQNVFHLGDVEYDLANGAIYLLRTQGDCEKANLAYWANAKGQAVSFIDIEDATHQQRHTRGEVYVNGERMRAIFDTGDPVTVLSPDAAWRAGVSPTTPGITYGGEWGGLGKGVSHSLIVPFDSFRIGDEEVQHTKLRVGDVGTGQDMLIGADFFLSHHILVATSQRRLYFTYNGGPVFNLTSTPAAATPADASATAAGAAGATAAVAADEHLDAAAYARRGAAETSRHDYQHAIADLTRACELAPAEAEYFYERGMAYLQTQQADPALADFDQAIKLKPDDVSALLARATVHAGRDDPSELIIADLDAADRVAPREDAARLGIGDLYLEAGKPEAAIAEYTKYIDSHDRDEVEVARALKARCGTRARAGRELEQALDDCDRAARRRPDDGSIYESRGLVQLRLGHYDRSIADYDKALKLSPRTAWSLYGRGIAKLHKGQTEAGRADLTAATAISPHIAEHAARYDIRPP